MRDPFHVLRSHYDRVAISTIHLAFALSLMLHAALLGNWMPKVHLLPFDESEQKKPGHSLAGSSGRRARRDRETPGTAGRRR